VVPPGRLFKFSPGLVAPLIYRTPFTSQRKVIFMFRGAGCKPEWEILTGIIEFDGAVVTVKDVLRLEGSIQ